MRESESVTARQRCGIVRLQAGLCAIYRPSSSSQLPSSLNFIISHTHSHTASAPFCLPLRPSPSLYLCCPLSLFSLSVSLCPSASSFLANYCETPSNINCFAILRGFLITNRRAGVRTYSVGAQKHAIPPAPICQLQHIVKILLCRRCILKQVRRT